MNKPGRIVSAIVSTYNAEQFIRGRIENLLDQTLGDQVEIIIVNSGSQQREDEIVREYTARHTNIRYIKTEKRETIYKAWNRGILLAKAHYITNANTDDRLRRDAFEKLAGLLDEHPDIGLVYADQIVTSIPNAPFSSANAKSTMRRPAYNRLRLLSGYIVGPQSLWRSKIHFVDNIWFDERYEVAGDYEFVCRVAEKYDLLHVPEYLGAYYIASDKSNKEFIDFRGTLGEAADIQGKHTLRYLDSLSDSQRKDLSRKLVRYMLLPKHVHIILFRLLRSLCPESPFLPRAFVCWVRSVMAEREGLLWKALKYCEECLDMPKATLIHRQHSSLKSKIDQNNLVKR